MEVVKKINVWIFLETHIFGGNFITFFILSPSPGPGSSRSPPSQWPQLSQPGSGLACVTEETEPGSLRQSETVSQGNSVYGRKNPWGNHSYADLISQVW